MQNLIDLTLSETQLLAVDQALTELETQLVGLIAMNTDQRRSLARMGDKSEAFCRQALTILSQNPQVVPPACRCPARRPTWRRWTSCGRGCSACSG